MFAPHTAARFQLESRAGGGGMGDIYRAQDLATTQPVAVKLLRKGASAEERARFLRETKVLADLRHPGIVTYIDHGRWTDGRLYLAMEWLDGEDLGKRLRRQPIGMADAVEVVRRAAQAMAAIHARGVVHRDLKMSNIFILHGGLSRGVKLIDFGVVKLPEPDECSTLPGSIIGTPYFMAPEQARGGPVDVRADVYSLGSVLFRLITGRYVFDADHIIAFLGRLVLEDAPLASTVRFDVPQELDALLASTLSRDPAARPEDAGALARILARLPALNNEPPNSDQSASAIRRVEPSPQRTYSDSSPSGWLVPGQTTAAAPPGASERRIIAVVLASVPPTSVTSQTMHKMRAIVGTEARVELLQGGQLIAALGLEKTQGDEAVRAARSALYLATSIAGARVAVATGHAVAGHKGLTGKALEHAAAQLERAAPGGVRVGRATGSLLQGRFVFRADESGLLLLHEDIAAADSQRLLGVVTPTLGRDREIELLHSAFRSVMQSSQPQAVLVTGPIGIGKSRLRHETIRQLTRSYPELDVLLARGDSTLLSTGLSALGRALRARMGIRDGEPAAQQADRVLHYVARHPGADPHAAGFLGEFVGVSFPGLISEPLTTARDAPHLMNARILQTLEAVIRRDGAIVPQLLVLEDVHLVDNTTVELIDALLSCRDLRLLVLAFARNELQQRNPQLWAKRPVVRLALGPLPAQACEQLTQLVLPELPAERKAKLIERAQGNALFLEELLRSAKENQDEVPLSVQALIQARLDQLPSEQRQVVRTAAIFGRQCWTQGVSQLVGRDCQAELEALARAEILTRQETTRIDGQVEWSFPQNLVQETAYSLLLEQDRAALHRAAASWLLQAGEQDLGTVARHAEAGQDRVQAANLYVRASAQAYSNGRLEAALDFAERACACSEDPTVQAQALLQKAQVLSWLGGYEQQRASAELASSFSEPGSNLWGEAQRLVGSALREQGLSTQAQERLDWTLAHSSASQLSPATRARLYAELTRALIDIGQPQRAETSAQCAIQDASQAGAQGANAMLRALDARFMALAFSGDFSGSIDAAYAVAQRADEAGDAVLATRARINLGFSLNRVGRFEEARTELERALHDARTLHMRAGEGFALHNIGMSLARLDDLDEAIALEHQAAQIGEELGHFRLKLSARIYQAQMLVWRGAPGDLGQALSLMEPVCTQSSVSPMACVQATALLGQVHLARREFEQAVYVCQHALGQLLQLGSMEEGEEGLRLAYAEALAEAGQGTQANEALRAAYGCVMQRCGQMSQPVHRETFLSRMAECRRIIQLAVERLSLPRPITSGPALPVPKAPPATR